MSIIVAHDTKTEITGLVKDNSYHVVDLSPFVSTNCLGVLLQFVNNHTTTAKLTGYKSTSNVTNRNISLSPKSHELFICKLDSNYQLELRCEDSNLSIFIQSEFFDGVFLWESDNWPAFTTGAGYIGGTWHTLTMTLNTGDSYSDVEAVLVRGRYSGNAYFGARPLGSTEDYFFLAIRELFALPVKVNSNGQYQIYFPQQGCVPIVYICEEIGYIKKGYNYTAFLEPPDLELSPNADWEDLDLSLILPSDCTHVVPRLLINVTGTKYETCGVRAKGSTNVVDILPTGIWAIYWPSVDSSGIIEYRYAKNLTSALKFSVWGYIVADQEPEPPIPPPEPENLPVSILNDLVVSLGSIMLELFNIDKINNGDIITTKLQHPIFGFGVITTNELSTSNVIGLSISGHNITVSNIDLDDSSVILLIFGF